MSNQKILEALYAAVDVVNEQLPPQAQLGKTAETIITGDDAGFDSMGLISFILAVESQTEGLFSQPLNLAENLLASEASHLPETLNELADLITGLGVGDDAAEF